MLRVCLTLSAWLCLAFSLLSLTEPKSVFELRVQQFETRSSQTRSFASKVSIWPQTSAGWDLKALLQCSEGRASVCLRHPSLHHFTWSFLNVFQHLADCQFVREVGPTRFPEPFISRFTEFQFRRASLEEFQEILRQVERAHLVAQLRRVWKSFQMIWNSFECLKAFFNDESACWNWN